MVERKNIWNGAAVAGWWLGGISSEYMAGTALLKMLEWGDVATFWLTTALWLLKFIACIRLVRFFMLRFSRANPEADNRDTFRFGVLLSLLSALIFSAFYLAWCRFIQPDMFQEMVDTLAESLKSVASASQLKQMQEMVPDMPVYGFFSNLIYCWAFGTVLSAVFARNIPSRNPFQETR